MNKNKQVLRVGIIGTGGISGVHLANLSKVKAAKLVSGCDIDKNRITKIARQYGCQAYTSYEKMIANETLDAVLLCTPQMVREGPISLCAKKHIPVFTEKPPSSDLVTAKRIDRIVKKHRLLVSVGFVFRYLKIVERALSLLKGRPILLIQLQYLCPMMYPDKRRNVRDFYYNRKLSGGLVLDQAIHLLDLTRYILKDEIKCVHAFGANVFQPKTKKITTEESITVNMRSSKGALVSYLHTWVHRGWKSRCEIFAPDISLNLDLPGKKLSGVVDGKEISYQPEDNGSFSELNAFLNTTKNQVKRNILSIYSDSVKTMALTTAIMKSIDTHKIVQI